MASSTAESVTFAFDESERTLLATYTPGEMPQRMTVAALRQLLSVKGFGELALLQEGLQELTGAMRAGTALTVPVAERREAEIEVTVSKDGLEAVVTVTRPQGGPPLDRSRLKNALFDAGIRHGIDSAVVSRILAAGHTDPVAVARGDPPEDGDNAWFEQLAKPDESRGRPRELPDGTVDFHELGTVVSVDVGQPLLRKHVATSGVSGTDIRGETLAAKPGKEAAFGPMNDSVRLADDDPLLVVAARSGQPRYGKSWVRVEPLLVLKAVDLESGNIHFDGNVVVHGTVVSGMSVWAAGDLIVNGVVEAATLEAGGNVELRGGVVGQNGARIMAKGNITARFVESATLEAGESLYVIDMALHCDLTALDSIEVRGGRRAQIAGGRARATNHIRAATVGAPAGVVTELEVGLNPYVKSQFDQLEKELDLRRRKVDEVSKALVQLRLRAKPDGAKQMKQFTLLRERLATEIVFLEERHAEMKAKLDLAANAKIIVQDRLYGGVKVRISDQVQFIKEDLQGCTFRLRRGEIAISVP